MWICILLSVVMVPWMILGWTFLPTIYGSLRHLSHSETSWLVGVLGISAARRSNDLPGGGPRTLRDPIGVHGVFVNGTKVFDGTDYAPLESGPGRVLDRFIPAKAAALASLANNE